MTEQEILKKFEELGYEILRNPQNENHIQIANEEQDTIIEVYNSIHQNHFWYESRRFGINEPQVITPKEHQLLTELFKCWGRI